MRGLSIKSRLLALPALVVIGVGALGYETKSILDKVKVTGEEYTEIITGKDLVADILPPPAFILESYLTTLELTHTDDQADIAALEAKLSTLQKDFETRQDFWSSTLSDGEMKSNLIDKSAAPARKFFELANTQFIPLINQGKHEEAVELLQGEMRAEYDAHRAAIDDTVKLATAFAAESEAHAKHANG